MNLSGFLGKLRRCRRALGLGEKLRNLHRMELMSQLASGMAHDLRNLMFVVNSNCEALLRSDLPLPAVRKVQNIHLAMTHGSGYLETLLSFARADSLAAATTNIDSMMRKMEPLLLCLIQQDSLLKLELHAEASQVSLHPVLLEQVVLNLVLNARDAISERGGEIRVCTCNVTVPPKGWGSSRLSPGDYVLLEVCDTGCGIDIATGSQIFEPFFSTKKGKGSGLGLTMVNGTVTRSGGEVQLTSIPGKGTTVRVFLPLAGVSQKPARQVRPVRDAWAPNAETPLNRDSDLGKRSLESYCRECLP